MFHQRLNKEILCSVNPLHEVSGSTNQALLHGLVSQVDHVSITRDAPSGVAPILVNEQGLCPDPRISVLLGHNVHNVTYIGENAIVIVSGANQSLSADDVQASESLISSAKVIVCQLEVPVETSLAALTLAKQHGGEPQWWFNS